MKVAVVGSGAWGTALAIRLCKNGHDVTMWTFETELIEEMETTRRNPRLPDAELPEELKISGEYGCVSGCAMVVVAAPSFPIRSVSRGIAPYLDENAVVVSVTKGIEKGTLLRMSEVVQQETGHTVVALTGPSHAEEVALDIPTACLSASENKELAVIMGNKLGYWYCLNSIKFDDNISSGNFNVKCFFENIGSAPAYKKFDLKFKLVGESSEYETTANNFDNRLFMPHTITVCDYNLDFGRIEKGSYVLKMSMLLGDTPIKLAISDDIIDQNGYVELCNIEIK